MRVIRNDQVTRAEVEAMADDPAQDLRGIVISPGPGDPDSAGVSRRHRRDRGRARGIPLLGVCLGMQSMGAAFGASIVRAPTLVHGEAARSTTTAPGCWRACPGRSRPPATTPCASIPRRFPEDLYVTATSPEDGVVMGLRHRTLPIEGVQFHPESVLTPDGPHLLANFLRLAGEGEAGPLDAASGSFATRGMAMGEDAAASERPTPGAPGGTDGRRRPVAR